MGGSVATGTRAGDVNMTGRAGWVGVVLLLCATLAAPAAFGAEFRGLAHAVPPRWTSMERDGALLLAPPGNGDEEMLVVALTGARPLGGTPFRGWFEEAMAASLSPQASVLAHGEVRSLASGGVTTLTTARVVRDESGTLRIQMFSAVSDGNHAGLAVVVAAGEQAAERHAEALQQLFASMHLRAAGAPRGAESPAEERHGAPPALPAGTYHCITTRWSPNQPIVLEPSILGTITIDGRGSYRVSSSGNSGSYRFGNGSLAFASGPLGGWPALVETVDGKPRVRLGKARDIPPNPNGSSFGEHRCTLRN
jgi:hypothetical protein